MKRQGQFDYSSSSDDFSNRSTTKSSHPNPPPKPKSKPKSKSKPKPKSIVEPLSSGYPQHVWVTPFGICFHRQGCAILGDCFVSRRSTDLVLEEGLQPCFYCFDYFSSSYDFSEKGSDSPPKKKRSPTNKSSIAPKRKEPKKKKTKTTCPQRVCVTPSGNNFHRQGCSVLVGRDFSRRSTDLVLKEGLLPCQHCFG